MKENSEKRDRGLSDGHPTLTCGEYRSVRVYFHVWFVTKYRRATLEGEIEKKAKLAFSEIARKKNYNILELETNRDHVHMLLEAENTSELAAMLRVLKSVSAKKILEDTPHLRVGNTGYYRRKPVEAGKSFWARRYGYRKIGEGEIEGIREYIRNQKKIPHTGLSAHGTPHLRVGHSGFCDSIPLPRFALWDKFKRGERKLVSFDLEITGRCNNNCRHCYINLPANDTIAKEKELSFSQIQKIVDQAVDLGALWCLITGGEPLLREDFFDIYIDIKKKGLLVSVFTNATLINKKHIEFFKKYPPRDIEVTVYGVTEKTYEAVTRTPGSFKAFRAGLNRLLENNIKVRFKAMALCSNVGELPAISEFCRQRTKDYFRFDPFLHLRFDADTERNAEIKSERLSPQEVVAIEKADAERFGALQKGCDKLIMPEAEHINCNHLFHCGAGNGSFTVSYDGHFRLCSSLWHKNCVYDLKSGSLRSAWQDFVPKIRDMRSQNQEFLQKCRKCSIINLCLWCPAHVHLETGRLDEPVDYFCEVAHARQEMLGAERLAAPQTATILQGGG